MAKAIGTVLRSLSAIWVVFALFRIVAGFTGVTRGNDIVIGMVGLFIAVATFKFGTWLKAREKGGSIADGAALAKSAWWRANYGFRLSVFLAVLWVIACYFWQYGYDRNLSLVFLPAIGLVAAYFGYLKFVVGLPTVEVDIPLNTHGTGDDPPRATVDEKSETVIAVSDQASRDRERAMNELINRMK